MGEAFFYHLTEDSLEQTLPVLVGKAVEAGWRVEVRGSARAQVEALDAALWKGAQDSFLAHGLAGGAHDADQPVLLTSQGDVASNGATCVVSVAGAQVTPTEVQAADRVMVVFDGMDGDAVARARVQWKELTTGGAAAKYWAQEGGRWIKKAES